MQPIWKRLRLFFRIIVSANQLSLYGAVAEICEVYESLHERTGQSSSSLVLSVIKTEVPLDCDDPANQDLLLQQYGERIEKLSQQDKLSGEGDGVPKACAKQAAADSRGSRTCVFLGVAHTGREG